MGVAAVTAVTVGLLVHGPEPLAGPSAPYDHEPLDEVSVATDDVVAGDAARLARGLAEEGVPCVQPRSNEVAVQISCAGPAGTVDLVAGPDGEIHYAAVDPVADTPSTLYRLLDASFLALWPQDRGEVDDLVADAEPDRDFTGSIVVPRDEDDQYPVRSVVTDSATWTLRSRYAGQLSQLHVRTDALTDRSWPFGGEHYAGTLAAAATVLTREGFTCGSYGGTDCLRPADQLRVGFDVQGEQVVVVRATLTSGVGQDVDPAQQVPALGTALTPRVRAAVADRLELCRRTGQEFRGVVAGTPLQVTTGYTQAPSLDVVIGVPLLYVE